ncbi:MAG: acetamidase/formamidase family protein [Oscillospiraceae bacterium]|nr:acetamidase/formamidase family protein [Oscillospiraceae bacterium]
MFHLTKDQVIYAMSPTNTPVLTIPPNSQIEFETADALSGQITSIADRFETLDWTRVNPATGPVYVTGAEPGDILSVTIEKIEIPSSGVTITGKGMGVVGHLLDEPASKLIPIEGDFALFSEKIRLPLNKMIGVIGVAPAEGAIPCGIPDLHGGNMDCKEIKEGATILLPVNVPGALLALGDLHAVMADGEICVSGLEVSGKVTVTVDVIKNQPLPLPMILSDTHVMTLASHEDLDQAVDLAVVNMVEYLYNTHGFEKSEAAMLLSLAGDVRICQVVDPKKTARVELRREYLK